MEDTTCYDIFKRELDNTTELVETVKEIEEAQKAVQKLKQQRSAEFFIFDPINGKVIDSVPAVD